MPRSPKATKKKSQQRRPRPSAATGRPRRGRPKICIFCSGHATWVDYKDVGLLKRFVNDRGRIKARGATGTCAQHQRDVATAVKTARELALLPYSVRTAGTESRGGRGGERRGSGTAPPTGDGSTSEESGSSSEAVEEADAAEGADSDEASIDSAASLA
jgi:small subunit ribosomal protein S18